MSFFDHLEELRVRLIRSFLALAIAVVIGYFLAPWPLEWLTRPIVNAQRTAAASVRHPEIRIEVGEDGTLRLQDPAQLGLLNSSPNIVFVRPSVEATLDTTPEPPLATWSGQPTPPIFYLRPMDPFMVRMQASVFLGLVISLPFILWQGWSFIAPGLLPSERRLAIPTILTGSLLFPGGAVFAYFLLDTTLMFFSTFIMDHAVMMNDARAYLGFALMMMLAFGLVFELPLVIVIAIRVGLTSVEWLSARRKHIFLVVLVLSAVITPTGDPLTMLAMGLPLYSLFEVALLVSLLLDRFVAKEKATMEDDDDEAPVT